MKVLHICNDFLGSKVHQNLYNQLNRIGEQQSVFYPSRIEKLHLSKKIIEESDYSIYISKPLKKYHKFFFRLKIHYLFKQISQKIRLQEFDLIHATTLYSDGALAYKIHKKHNIPYIISIRSTDIEVYLKLRPDLFFLALKILKNAQRVVFISNSLYNKFLTHLYIKVLKSRLQKKSHIIYNGVDNVWLYNTREKQNLEPSKIIYIGSLIKRKNSDLLSKAIVQIAHKYPDKNLKLTVVGDGPLKRDILLIQQDYPDIISYVKPIYDEDKLKELLRNHHIFAMPSDGETFGLVYIEALSQGLPVLGLVNEGIYGIFKEPVGIFATDSSLKSIEYSLDEIIKNYPCFNFEHVNFNMFDWSFIAKSYSDLYHNAMSDHAKLS